MKKFIQLFILTTASISASANIYTMVGETNYTDAKIWINQENSNALTARYFEKSNPAKISTAKILPSGDDLYTNISTAVLSSLKPNTEYVYEIVDESSKSTGSFKTKQDFIDRAPPHDFSFIAIGENHINDKDFDLPFRTPGGEYEIYDVAKNAKPNFALWVGSLNTLRNADLPSKTAIADRFLSIKDLAQAQSLFTAQPNYGVMGKNILKDSVDNSAKSYVEAFDLSWENPKTLDKNGRYYSFSYSDADFFVLDTFSYSKNLDYKQDWATLLGDKQMKWLMNSLQNSTATFKFIVTSKPFANPVESNEYFYLARKERQTISDFLFDKKISGVVIISKRDGYAEMTKFIRAGVYPLFEISAGPMTARADKEVKEMNYFRIPSSAKTQRTFTKVEVVGKEGDRKTVISFIDSKGNTLFSQEIKASELK